MENIINPSDKARIVFPQSKKKTNTLFGEAGQIISAIVTNKENGKTTLKTKDDIFLQFPDDKIKADKGDEIFLKVIARNKKEVSLKQINIPFEKMQKHLLKQLDLKSLKDLMQKNDFLQPEENVLSPKTMNENAKTEEKTMKAIKKIKRQLVYASNNVTQSAIAELAANGVSIEKISVKTMNAVIKEIAANPENRKNLQKTTYYNKNIIVDAYRKVDDIRRLSDGAIAKLIKSEKPVTVENIYIAKYSEKNSSRPMDEDTLDNLMPEIRKIMEREGIGLTDGNIELARFLAGNEICINKSNIEKAEFLKNIANNIDYDYILNGALSMTQNGGEPFDFVIYGENKVHEIDWRELDLKYSSIMEDIPKITARHIKVLLKRNDPVTIKGLQDLLNNDLTVKRKDQPGGLLFEEAETGGIITAETFTNKRYLAEIQLKLTWEAAARLADKNITIDTVPLQEAVNHLRAIENEKYIEILEASDAVASMENTSKMADLFNHIRKFMPINYNAAPEIMNHTVPFTIEGISAANTKAIERYENFASYPSTKYGDTFNKIAEQIAPVLESLGAGNNEENIKAAEIMIKNNMELNIDNLYEIKLINGKISEIYDRLNPMIAADMIKNGLNPSDMDIDEVISYIDNFGETFGDNTIDKIAKYIKQIEDSKQVSKEERDSVIAVYRMLNYIKKDGNSILGAVYKANKKFTLGNLMESSKYLQKTKGGHHAVDKFIDINQGEAEIVLSEELTIKDTLEKTKEQAYYEYAFKRFGNYANGKTLEHLVSNSGFKDMDIETAMNELQTVYKDKNTEDKQFEQYMQKINNIAHTSQSAIKFMENNNIPFTLNNIDVIKNYISDKKYFSNSINKLRDSLRNKDIDLNIDDLLPNTGLYEIRKGDGALGIGEDFIERLDDIIVNTDDPIVMEEIDVVKKIAAAMASSPWRTGNHNVPILFGGRITDVDMYILNENIGQSEKTDMFISLDAGALGEVNLLVKTNKDKVSLIISAKDETALQSLEDNTELLNDLIKESGFSIDDVRFQLKI